MSAKLKKIRSVKRSNLTKFINEITRLLDERVDVQEWIGTFENLYNRVFPELHAADGEVFNALCAEEADEAELVEEENSRWEYSNRYENLRGRVKRLIEENHAQSVASPTSAATNATTGGSLSSQSSREN
jgi:hypothetical protein